MGIRLGIFFLAFISCANASSTLPVGLVQISSPPSTALIVDKSKARLEVYQSLPDGTASKVKQYEIATGKQLGNKKQRGDMRTPEGIYFFTEEKKKTELLPKYGDGAFVMDYPNRFDRLEQKTGGGIWLHGTDETYRVSAQFDSEGCVVLRNEDLKDVGQYLRLQETPILIYPEIPRVEPKELQSVRGELNSFVENWRQAWEGKNLENYMGLYSQIEFFSRNMNWTQWKSYKESLNSRYKSIQIQLTDVRIFHYHPYAYVTFLQQYDSDMIHELGSKRLGLVYEANQWKIVEELFFSGRSTVVSRTTSATL